MCRQLFHHLSLSFDASTHYNNSLQWLCLITIFSTSQPLHPFPEHVCRWQPARTRSSLYIFLCFISLCSYGRLIVRALPRWRLSRSRVRQNDNTHTKLTKKNKKNRRWSSTLNSSQNITILAHFWEYMWEFLWEFLRESLWEFVITTPNVAHRQHKTMDVGEGGRILGTFLRICENFYENFYENHMRIRDYHPKRSPQTTQNHGCWRGWQNTVRKRSICLCPRRLTRQHSGHLLSLQRGKKIYILECLR